MATTKISLQQLIQTHGKDFSACRSLLPQDYRVFRQLGRCLATERWLQSVKSILLDCPHHHMIFTFPHALNELWRFNRELMSDLLFSSVRETLKTFSQDERYLKVTPGILSV